VANIKTDIVAFNDQSSYSTLNRPVLWAYKVTRPINNVLI